MRARRRSVLMWGFGRWSKRPSGRARAALERVLVLALFGAGAACTDDGLSGPEPGPLAGRAFVVNSLGGTLSIVGRREADGRLVAENDVAELGAGSTAVVLAVGDGAVAVPDGSNNRLLVFDEATLARRCAAALPSGSSPNGVAIAGGDAYVSLLLADGVARVDLATCTVEQIAAVGPAPADVEVLGETLLVVLSNIDLRTSEPVPPRLGESYVAFLDALTLELRDTTGTGGTNAQFAAFDREGELLVVNSGEFGAGNSTIAVLDPIARRLVAGPFPIGDFGGTVAVGPDGRAYVTSFGDGLYVFDATENRVLRTASNSLFAPGPFGERRGSSGVAVDRRGNILSLFFGEAATPGQVFLFDSEETLVDSAAVGFGPFAIALEEAARPE